MHPRFGRRLLPHDFDAQHQVVGTEREERGWKLLQSVSKHPSSFFVTLDLTEDHLREGRGSANL